MVAGLQIRLTSLYGSRQAKSKQPSYMEDNINDEVKIFRLKKESLHKRERKKLKLKNNEYFKTIKYYFLPKT